MVGTKPVASRVVRSRHMLSPALVLSVVCRAKERPKTRGNDRKKRVGEADLSLGRVGKQPARARKRWERREGWANVAEMAQSGMEKKGKGEKKTDGKDHAQTTTTTHRRQKGAKRQCRFP